MSIKMPFSAWRPPRDPRHPVASRVIIFIMSRDRCRMLPTAQSRRTTLPNEFKARDWRAQACAQSHLAQLYNRKYSPPDKLLGPLIQTLQMPSMTHQRAPSYISRTPWRATGKCTNSPSTLLSTNHNTPTRFILSTYPRIRWTVAHLALYVTMSSNSHSRRPWKSHEPLLRGIRTTLSMHTSRFPSRQMQAANSKTLAMVP